jgi:predicted metal-dependent phosphoesterase TrpH
MRMLLGDFHIHSIASDGEAHPKDIVKYARKIGLSVVAITDHNTFTGSVIAEKASVRGITIVFGAEVRSVWGDILLLCPQPTKIEVDPYTLRERANRNNCLLIPAHPFDVLRLGIGGRVWLPLWDGVEVFNGNSDPVTNTLTSFLLHGYNMPKLSNSDAHVLSMVGSTRNIIFAENPARDEVLEAIRKGRLKPLPSYSVRGLKDRFSWAIKRKKLVKKYWVGEALTGKLSLPWS